MFGTFASDDVYVLGPAKPLTSADRSHETGSVSVRSAEHLGDLHGLLKLIGPVDIIVDLWSARRAESADIWRTLFFHLRPGGSYVPSNRQRTPPTEPTTVAGSRPGPYPAGAMASLGDLLDHSWRAGGGESGLGPLDAELVASSGRFIVDRDFILVQKRMTHYLKLRESDVDRLFPLRNSRDTVTTLASLPSGTLEPRGIVISHPAAVPISGLPPTVEYPELRLHHYRGKFGMGSEHAGLRRLDRAARVVPLPK